MPYLVDFKPILFHQKQPSKYFLNIQQTLATNSQQD
jgi:hypothetical protein